MSYRLFHPGAYSRRCPFREKHAGIDYKALLRVSAGVLTGRYAGGGSTITQQLAKNLFPRGQNLSTPAFILRKFKEWVTAVKLERNYTKEEILAMYLNTVDFGSNAFGVKSAANTFFSKEPRELNAEESALLIAIVNAPTRYSPIRNPENALKRRNLVLAKWLNMITSLNIKSILFPTYLSTCRNTA
jgi:penicillin-binding protein 1A